MTLHAERMADLSLRAHVVAASSLIASKIHDKSNLLLLWLATLFLTRLLKPPTLIKAAFARHHKTCFVLF